MPTYVYRCSDCGHEFEEFQSITEKPLKICPKCKGKINRVIQAGAGFLFKGSGFYQTDYRSGEYKKKASEDSSSKKDTKTKKTESKTSPSKKTNTTKAS